MFILLPPSEGKAASGAGAPLDLSTLSTPKLNPTRERVLNALVRLSALRDQERARTVLGLSPRQQDELARNARLRDAPTLPAGQLYTGVLYDALDLSSLAPAAYQQAQRSILIFSALWGAVRLDDALPPYRCSPTVNLPRFTGNLAAYWRRPLATALPPVLADQAVLDLRSSAYSGMWAPAGPAVERTLTARVLHEQVVDGVAKRSVVSHFNKATKGRLVRDLLTAGVEPSSMAELVGALRDLKYTVELAAATATHPARLDIIVTEV